MDRFFRRILNVSAAAAMLVLAAGCSSVPDDVIPPEEMAPIIADTHLAESIVDYSPADFPTDSSRLVLMADVYAAHGVTRKQVDASLQWYGRHLKLYKEVYDQAIVILEDRRQNLGAQIAGASAVTYVGDSVDVWSLPRHAVITPRSPAQGIRIEIPADAEMQPGDVYTWRAKMLNNEPNTQIRWSMLALYEDGTVETFSSTSSIGQWRKFDFATDSTRRVAVLRGAAMVDGPAVEFSLDSISLMRRRLSPANSHIHNKNKIYRTR